MAGWVSSYHYGGHTYNRGDALVLNGSYYYDITDPTPNGTLNNETRYFYGVFVFDDGSLPLNPVGISNAQAASSSSGGTIRFDTIVSGGTPDTFTYSFNANGGSGAPSSMTKTYGVHFTFPSTKPTRTGYTFNGWYNSNVNNGTVYAGGTQYIGLPDQNITWYASWTANNYKITYNPNGGSDSAQTQTVAYGSAWQSKGAIFSKTGYTQTSWNTKADGTGVSYALNKQQTNAQLSNLTLYAIYKANTYYIKYDGNGSTGGSMGNSTHTYNVSKELTKNAFTKTGYSFNGWNTKSDGSGIAYANQASVKNLTSTNGATVNLYAQWKINQHTLTVNPNGGVWSGNSEIRTFSQDYNSTKSIPDPERTGYEFDGWTLSGSGVFESRIYTFGAGNGTLTARWKRIILTVTFDAEANGGTPNSSKEINHGDPVGVLPTPEKTYYKFVGWFTLPVGGAQISASQVITENVIYYAQYKIDASVKVMSDSKKKPAIVWIKVDGIWRRCLTLVKQNGKWLKSTGA